MRSRFVVAGLCVALTLALFGTATAGASSGSGKRQRPHRQQSATPVSDPAQECGISVIGRAQLKRWRAPRIIAGHLTAEGQFPWQVSLELLHPSLGFLGHWCGGVLINEKWIIAAAHCVHNDLFNLPLPALWTAVLGEYDRTVESGNEQRISIEKIVLHDRYHNYQNDLVLMKLSQAANISDDSMVRKICLPFANVRQMGTAADRHRHDESHTNYAMPVAGESRWRGHSLRTGSMPLENNVFNLSRTMVDAFDELAAAAAAAAATTESNSGEMPTQRRNDKFAHGKVTLLERPTKLASIESQDLQYQDCIATGWGKATMEGDLTDFLLQTKVPLHKNKRCETSYNKFVRIHPGHLCAGSLSGRSGTCVGDSGGPLQCRLKKGNQNGPYILAGITSFGSGCALRGFPDVYTRISTYMKWIMKTMSDHS